MQYTSISTLPPNLPPTVHARVVRFYPWRPKLAVAYTFPLKSKLLSLKSETPLNADNVPGFRGQAARLFFEHNTGRTSRRSFGILWTLKMWVS